MSSKYQIFKEVVETGNMSKAAAELGYSQSAVSLTIKQLESELMVTLLKREKKGVTLTEDGESYMPFINALCNAENALYEKRNDMNRLKDATVRIGTFTSVSRNLLPLFMYDFKLKYPDVRFTLSQGTYPEILSMTQEGSVDFCFSNSLYRTPLHTRELFRDPMMAVLPPDHPLASKKDISIYDLADIPYILLEEGDINTSLKAFEEYDLVPKVEYTIADNYTILAMISSGLGCTVMNKLTLSGLATDAVIRPIKENISRSVDLAWKQWNTMPIASQRFAEYIIRHTPERISDILAAESL